MVGAGTLYFKRKQSSSDQYGFHHLGNATSFSITTDIEKIDKNSSMNRHRELMASVVTSIKPTASIVLEEYNPYNLALGLFGEEGVFHQATKALLDEEYTVAGNPSIISLVDADGNKYFNVTNITVKPQNAIPATIKAVSVTSSMTKGTTVSADDTLTDTAGGKLQLATGSYSGSDDLRIFITVNTAPTAAGDLDGLVLEVREGASGVVQTFNGTPGTSQVFTLTCGVTITASVSTLDTFTVSAAMNEARVTAAVTSYKAGRDYVVEEVESRAGFVKITENGIIKKGDTVKISATVPEGDFITVAGATAGFIEGELLFIGDPNNGGKYNIEGWKVRVNPDGELSGLISENEFGNFTLSVDFLSDRENHPDAPFFRATHLGNASGEATSAGGHYDPRY